jgi:SAM-dependent methyltransferase
MARYDDVADFYDSVVRDRLDDNAGTLALMDLLGDVRGREVLDLACGQGRVARELARRGASVVGVDLSGELIAKACASEAANPLGISYAVADAASPDVLAAATFDLVVCNFGLSDIDDLGGALATIARVLRSHGAFAFSILHPCFPGWGDDAPSSWRPDAGYFREGWWQAQNPGFRGKVGANHRKLSTYVNALEQHGLPIERVVEPRPDEWPEPSPKVPVYLVVRSHKRD